jgi:hypothetical protein
MGSIWKHWSAWLPIAMSLTVFGVMVFCIVMFGPPVREPDEGAAAHLFQLWLVLEVLLVAFFAVRWLPRRPVEALVILAIQMVAVLAACFPVYYFGL